MVNAIYTHVYIDGDFERIVHTRPSSKLHIMQSPYSPTDNWSDFFSSQLIAW